MCAQLRIKSKTTLRSHLKYLIEQGYLIDEGSYYIINTYKEDIFLKIDLDTVQFLNDTVKEAVWKAYIYLGQRWSWKGSGFVFTLEDLGKHIGKPPNHNSKVYTELNNILTCLQNNGLIQVVDFYNGKVPQKRLVSFSLSHKRNN